MRRIITLEDLISDALVIGLICLQYGDTGKGGIIHLIAPHVKAIARGTGGANAGHTFIHHDEEMIAHQIPSGILYDKQGLISIMGRGMAIDPMGLVGELNRLDEMKAPYNNLRIDANARVVLDYHKREDSKNTTSAGGKIGSTGMGIGQCYEEETGRRGLTIRDLFNEDALREKLKEAKDRGAAIDIDKTIADLRKPSEKIKQYVADTARELAILINSGKRVGLEGAQGTFLGIKTGHHPYVTSSDSTIDGLCKGVGISANAVDLIFGLIKFPIMTRVGNGPFATELGGVISERHCSYADGVTNDIFQEVNTYLNAGLDLSEIRQLQTDRDFRRVEDYRQKAISCIKANREKIVKMMNSADPFVQGIGWRFAAFEYGATTGRPRRPGWTDAEIARVAARENGLVGRNKRLQLVLTKLDCANDFEKFMIGYGYRDLDGVKREFTRDTEEFRKFNPILRAYPGYGDLVGTRTFDELPSGLRRAITDLEKYLGTTATILSTGRKDEDKIYRLPNAA
jgi:adenylosuccinate synthase